MDNPERGVTVLHRLRDDTQRHEVVDLIQIDLLAPQLLVNAEQALDPAVDVDDRHLRLGELRRDVLRQLLDQPFGRAPA